MDSSYQSEENEQNDSSSESFGSHTANLIKAASPYFDTDTQKSLYFIATILDVMEMTKLFQQSKSVSALSFSMKNVDFEGLLKNVRPVCRPNERSFVDKITNMFSMKRMFETYQAVSSMMSSMNSDSSKNTSSAENPFPNNQDTTSEDANADSRYFNDFLNTSDYNTYASYQDYMNNPDSVTNSKDINYNFDHTESNQQDNNPNFMQDSNSNNLPNRNSYGLQGSNSNSIQYENSKALQNLYASSLQNSDTSGLQNSDLGDIHPGDLQNYDIGNQHNFDSENPNNFDSGDLHNFDSENQQSFDSENSNSFNSENQQNIDLVNLHNFDSVNLHNLDSENLHNLDSDNSQNFDSENLHSFDSEHTQNSDSNNILESNTYKANKNNRNDTKESQLDNKNNVFNSQVIRSNNVQSFNPKDMKAFDQQGWNGYNDQNLQRKNQNIYDNPYRMNNPDSATSDKDINDTIRKFSSSFQPKNADSTNIKPEKKPDLKAASNDSSATNNKQMMDMLGAMLTPEQKKTFDTMKMLMDSGMMNIK